MTEAEYYQWNIFYFSIAGQNPVRAVQFFYIFWKLRFQTTKKKSNKDKIFSMKLVFDLESARMYDMYLKSNIM